MYFYIKSVSVRDTFWNMYKLFMSENCFNIFQKKKEG